MMLLALVVVELFTSQGCSSCPSADALLAKLDKDPNVLVLSEHVDYWNSLGWRDPFSSSVFTDRQQRYARRFAQDGPYTPQMVVDGKLQFVGSDARKARAAIAQTINEPRIPLTIEREGNQVTVAVSAPMPKGAELWVALLRPDGMAEVPRGENAGRTLRHVGIVRSLKKTNPPHRFTLPPPEGGPWRVVAFVQESGQGAILGSARSDR